VYAYARYQSGAGFLAAGLPSTLQPEVGRWLRSQVPLTIAMESVAGTAVQGQCGPARERPISPAAPDRQVAIRKQAVGRE
jgi:hypothetical protein